MTSSREPHQELSNEAADKQATQVLHAHQGHAHQDQAAADPVITVQEAHHHVMGLFAEMSKGLVGQHRVAQRLFMALLAGGHVLLEGLPGLAKTTSIRILARICDLEFKRIQFTPDLMPADITGTEIYHIQTGEFRIKKGPIFCHLLLADEINRAPSKVQAALLEAMGERQVTLASHKFELEDPFLVLATQNPIDQEGTYSLPEAQLDRFLFKLHMGYGTLDDEVEIMKRASAGGGGPGEGSIGEGSIGEGSIGEGSIGEGSIGEGSIGEGSIGEGSIGEGSSMGGGSIQQPIQTLLNRHSIAQIRRCCLSIHVSDEIRRYIASISFATRYPSRYELAELETLISFGASPRASLAMELTAKIQALFHGRDFVTPSDVKEVAYDVLNHRLVLSFEAQADRVTVEHAIDQILAKVPVP